MSYQEICPSCNLPHANPFCDNKWHKGRPAVAAVAADGMDRSGGTRQHRLFILSTAGLKVNWFKTIYMDERKIIEMFPDESKGAHKRMLKRDAEKWERWGCIIGSAIILASVVLSFSVVYWLASWVYSHVDGINSPLIGSVTLIVAVLIMDLMRWGNLKRFYKWVLNK